MIRLQISQGVGAVITSSLGSGGHPVYLDGLPPAAVPPAPGCGPPPPPPPLPGSLSIPGAPPLPPPLGMMRPPGPGSPYASQAEQLPNFVKPKKKYQPETQMKRANWTKVILSLLLL